MVNIHLYDNGQFHIVETELFLVCSTHIMWTQQYPNYRVPYCIWSSSLSKASRREKNVHILSSYRLVFPGQHQCVGRGWVGVLHWLFHSFPGLEDQGKPIHIGSFPHSHRSADGLQRLRCMCVNVSVCAMCV